MEVSGLAEYMHFDPITLVAFGIGGVVIWTQLRSTVKWHTAWIAQHEKDAKERDAILGAVRTTNEKLTVLTEAHDHRLERIENTIDRSALNRARP